MSHDIDIAPDIDDETDESTPVALTLAPGQALPLATSFPESFPLIRLLQFVPDIRLKRRAEALAKEALAIDVAGAEGVTAADRKLPELRALDTEIEDAFAFACDTSNQLHKRMTGLRGDFTQILKDAIVATNDRVYRETLRLRNVAEEERRLAQDEADRKAREDAAAAAKIAKMSGAPKDVIQDLRQQAKTAVAPAVPASTPAPRLASSSTVVAFKARLKGTPHDSEPNPDTAALSKPQQEQVRRLCAAIGQGLEPLAAISLNWSYLNTRASREKTTFAITGLEAFDAGGMRAKPRRK